MMVRVGQLTGPSLRSLLGDHLTLWAEIQTLPWGIVCYCFCHFYSYSYFFLLKYRSRFPDKDSEVDDSGDLVALKVFIVRK